MVSLWSATMHIGLLFSGPIAELEGVSFWFLLTGIFITVFTVAGWLFGRNMKPKEETGAK